MKAITRNKYGPPEVLSIREVEKPTIAENELLVKVYATTVSRTDCGILWGKPFILRFFTGLIKPGLFIPGTDFAGVIEEVGEKVQLFHVGDRVWGFDDNGLSTNARYLKISEDKAIANIPEGISFQRAAAAGEGAHYAYNFINKVKLQPGQEVLVNGATGAIGSAAVQLLKFYNVKITAVCDAEHLELVKSMGADQVIDYTREDFTKIKQRFHFVFDAVGKSSFSECKPLLLPGGVYISSELGANGENPLLALWTLFFGKKKVVFPLPTNISRSVRFINELMEKGQFEPVIDRVYKMDEVKDAYRFVASGQKIGNVVLMIEDE